MDYSSKNVKEKLRELEFARDLKHQRQEGDFTQQDAADRLGMNLRAYQEYEQGRVFPSSISNACGMLIDLDCNPSHVNERYRPHLDLPENYYTCGEPIRNK